MPGATVTILYPNGSDIKFDDSYYLSSHMPMVQSNWKQYGLNSYTVTKPADTTQYICICILNFDSLEGFKKASAGEEAKAVMGDVPNYTNSQPLLVAGEVTGSA